METIKGKALLMAADLGSMTAAAEALGYTQSGITRMISSLEEEIGFPLLSRGKAGVKLTENGRLMIPAIRKMVNAAELVNQLAAEVQHVATGVITIGSYFSISALWLPKILSAFEKKYPKVSIRIQEGGNQDMAKWINEKSVDCCFCAKPDRSTVCDWIPISTDELVVWLSETHKKAGWKSFPLADLEKEPFIQTSPNKDTDLDRLIRSNHLQPDVRFTTRDAFSTYNMVSAGLGVSFNQRLISREWNGHVVEVPFDPPQYIVLGLAVPSLQEASPATLHFLECVKELMDNDELLTD